jgi:hypothetical protein
VSNIIPEFLFDFDLKIKVYLKSIGNYSDDLNSCVKNTYSILKFLLYCFAKNNSFLASHFATNLLVGFNCILKIFSKALYIILIFYSLVKEFEVTPNRQRL